MSTLVSTSSHTRTQTATYLAEVILGAVADLLGFLGISSDRLYREWPEDEAAIKQWIAEQSLAAVHLECIQPDGTVAPVLEFPVTYDAYGLGDRQFTAQRAKLARYSDKLRRVPAGTRYRLVCSFRSAHTQMPNWEPTTRASTNALRSTSFGVLGSAPHASASLRVHQ